MYTSAGVTASYRKRKNSFQENATSISGLSRPLASTDPAQAQTWQQSWGLAVPTCGQNPPSLCHIWTQNCTEGWPRDSWRWWCGDSKVSAPCLVRVTRVKRNTYRSIGPGHGRNQVLMCLYHTFRRPWKIWRSHIKRWVYCIENNVRSENTEAPTCCPTCVQQYDCYTENQGAPDEKC